jgi:hypothetical protein
MAHDGAYHYVRNAQSSLDTQKVAGTSTIHRPEDSFVEGRALKINSVRRRSTGQLREGRERRVTNYRLNLIKNKEAIIA